MDPLSITAAATGILSSIFDLSKQISSFVSTVRDARKDMDGVSRELTSLSLSPRILQDESPENKARYPVSLQQTLTDVLNNCDKVVVDMQVLLTKLSSGGLGRKMQWAFNGRDEMHRMRSSLEAHKQAIDIALEVGAIALLNTLNDKTEEVMADTGAIKDDTGEIRENASALVREVRDLRAELSRRDMIEGKAGIFDRFFAASEDYAQSVADVPNEGHLHDPFTNPIEEEHDSSTAAPSQSSFDVGDEEVPGVDPQHQKSRSPQRQPPDDKMNLHTPSRISINSPPYPEPEFDLYNHFTVEVDSSAIHRAEKARANLTEERRVQIEHGLQMMMEGFDEHVAGQEMPKNSYDPISRLVQLLDQGAGGTPVELTDLLHKEITNAHRLEVVDLLLRRGACASGALLKTPIIEISRLICFI